MFECCLGDEKPCRPFTKSPKSRPHPGGTSHFVSWDSAYPLVIPIKPGKSRFGDMRLTELVSCLFPRANRRNSVAPSSAVESHSAASPHWQPVEAIYRIASMTIAHLRRSRPPGFLACRHERRKQCPFPVRQIACVASTTALIITSSDFHPHVVPPRLL